MPFTSRCRVGLVWLIHILIQQLIKCPFSYSKPTAKIACSVTPRTMFLCLLTYLVVVLKKTPLLYSWEMGISIALSWTKHSFYLYEKRVYWLRCLCLASGAAVCAVSFGVHRVRQIDRSPLASLPHFCTGRETRLQQAGMAANSIHEKCKMEIVSIDIMLCRYCACWGNEHLIELIC